MGEVIRTILALLKFLLSLILATVSAIQQIELPDPTPAVGLTPGDFPLTPDRPRPAPATFPEAERVIFEQINAERTACLAPFTLDPALTEIARLRAADMLARHYVSHYDPKTGERADWTLELQRGVPAGAEIIYWTNGSAEKAAAQVVPWWMGSEGHRASLLGQHGRLGIGLATSDGRVIVVGVLLP